MNDDHKPHRYKSARLPHYDYSSPGGYSVTMVTTNRIRLFGNILDEEMVLNERGTIIREEWLRSAKIRAEIQLDEFIVMPNHFHGIVFIRESDPVHCRATLPGVELAPRKLERSPRPLSTLVSGFKAYSTKRINELRGTPGQRVWQPGFNEHVIRSDHDLRRIREYIINNPLKWHLDQENPENTR